MDFNYRTGITKDALGESPVSHIYSCLPSPPCVVPTQCPAGSQGQSPQSVEEPPPSPLDSEAERPAWQGVVSICRSRRSLL